MALTHPEFPLHRLRVVQPNLCDSNVKQYSGYLDISETKHLFFWFEESRHKPKDDPLVLWYVKHYSSTINTLLITQVEWSVTTLS